jgi:ribosome biogenesis GTPase
LPIGIIQKGIGGFYYVMTSDGIYECRARGIFRKDGLTPLPGDRVIISDIDECNKTGVIDEILIRDNELVRPAVANIDQIVAVIAVKSPAPDYNLLDKILVTSEYKQIKSILCINKIDLNMENKRNDIKSIYEKAKYPVILTSSHTGEGFDELVDNLKDKTTVIAGQSGVGKSTILNVIMNSQVMETGSISERGNRGKHTTRHAEIVKLKQGGFLVDTPGFSSFELSGMEHHELGSCYPEFDSYPESCRFVGCSHINEPGCCVKAALEKGLIDTGRYERYVQFYNFLASRDPYK